MPRTATGGAASRCWRWCGSAQRHGLDPQRYLTSVLAKIGQTPLSELEQFLPDVWKADCLRETAASPGMNP